MSREQLTDWSRQMARRFDGMLEINPPECNDVIVPPRDAAVRLQSKLSEPDAAITEINDVAGDVLEEFADWKGLQVDELKALALHVQEWCRNECGGELSDPTERRRRPF